METLTHQFLEDHEQFEKLKQDPKEVKAVVGKVPFSESIKLYDISLKARTWKEDQIFATNKEYREIIRRGLSYIEDEHSKVTLLRRGLQKFFDIRTEYFDVLEGKVELSETKISTVEKGLYHVIFDEVKRVLDNGGKVLVYKTEKANGENAQITYNKKLDAWVVSSKNVSIVIRNQDDIEEYRKEAGRYAFAVLIADSWLKLLKLHVKDVEGLKKELDGRTLIGEYCGHPLHEHLVAYKEISIFFFASVELRGTNKSCNTMHFTESLLNKHNLPIVKINMRGECANVKEFIALLKELFKEVSENTIEEDAEGSVIYFEAKQEEEHSAEILSLCKLKTLEYRLFRKLREKLKNIIAKEKTVEEQMAAYKKEVASLTKEYNTPRPLEYYYEIAGSGFEFVFNNKELSKKVGLSNRFLSFLNVLRDCREKHKKPTPDDFQKMLDTANPESEESDFEDEN